MLKFAIASLLTGVAAPVIAQPVEPMRLALIESMSGPFANTGEGVFHNLQ